MSKIQSGKGGDAAPEPHLYVGASIPALRQVLARHKGQIDRRGRLAGAVAQSAALSPLRRVERARTSAAVAATPVNAPVFVIGHWRTGTTHLHNLLSQDPQFGFVTGYQSFHPLMCVVGRGVGVALNERFGNHTRPLDEMAVGPDMPQEEEFGLANLTPHAFYHGMIFGRERLAYADRYCTFATATPEELEGWRRAYVFMLRKAAWLSGGKRLVTKNPPNTGRIPQLLELFPDAKFIHIHRNPYEVYVSARHAVGVFDDVWGLQELSPEQLEADVVEAYRRLMSKYLSDRSAVPAGQIAEVAFDDLKRDPVGELERIYGELELGGFATARPAVEAYVATLSGYRPNRYITDQQVLRRVNEAWHLAFDAWGYERARPDEGTGSP
jgi:omega-hydroxy-beta-dihydromenaquinone-9 sulfotransferase